MQTQRAYRPSALPKRRAPRSMSHEEVRLELARKNARQEKAKAKMARRNPFALVVALVFAITLFYVAAWSVNSYLNYKNHQMLVANERLAGEVESLRIEQEITGNVSAIEKMAKKDLGMVYPTGRQFVKIRPGTELASSFTDEMRRLAF